MAGSDVVGRLGLIDLSKNKETKDRYLQLKHAEKIKTKMFFDDYNLPFGFLPNGDLIMVSLDKESKDYKIYLYPFKNKPTANTVLWEYSQVYDIEIHESLKSEDINCVVYQTKLFLYGCQSITQLDLSTMAFDMQYFFDYKPKIRYWHTNLAEIVVNKNQTLLALLSRNNQIYQIDIYSMETGVHVSRYG